MKKDYLEFNDLQKIKKFITKYIKWRYFIQHIFDKIVPYKKYELDFERLPYINIDELIKEYNQLHKTYTYKK